MSVFITERVEICMRSVAIAQGHLMPQHTQKTEPSKITTIAVVIHQMRDHPFWSHRTGDRTINR